MKSVIIYSQSREFRSLIQALIEDDSLKICESASRRELFELCRLEEFDILLTDDYRMFMCDEGATTRIRAKRAYPEIFVFSYDISEDSVVALLEMGINQFITLPLTPKRLRRKVLGHN